MQHRSRACVLLVALFCAPGIQAEVTLVDVAFVAVPAFIGAFAGRENVKQAIQAERKELEQSQGKYQEKFADLTLSQKEVELSQLILKSTKSSKKVRPEEIALLNEMIDDMNQNIHEINQATEETRDCRNRLQSAKNKLEQKGISDTLLHEGNQRLYEWDQDIRRYEKHLMYAQDWKRVFEMAKNRKEASLADTELVNQMTKDLDKEGKEINKKLDKICHKLQGVTQDLTEIASDEPKRLIKGILVGGAVGAGVGLVARGVAKYEIGQRKKRYEEANSIPLWRSVGHSKAVVALNLPRSATLDEVKKQYRTLALQYHPDKHPNPVEASEKFRAIDDAYKFLVDFFKSEEPNTTRHKGRPCSQVRPHDPLPRFIK